MNITAIITHRGLNTCTAKAGSVDADIHVNGEWVGEATLMLVDGRLRSWGALDNWACVTLIEWIESESDGSWFDAMDGIISAVRLADGDASPRRLSVQARP